MVSGWEWDGGGGGGGGRRVTITPVEIFLALFCERLCLIRLHEFVVSSKATMPCVYQSCGSLTLVVV